MDLFDIRFRYKESREVRYHGACIVKQAVERFIRVVAPDCRSIQASLR
jgi:hypothetical protein